MSTARDVMASPAPTVPATASAREVARRLRWAGAAAAAVVDSTGTVIGVISVEDVLSCVPGVLLEEGAPVPTAASLMTAPAVAVAPGAELAELAWQMHRNDVRQVPVVDRDGHALGMVRRVDVLRTFLRGTAEIRRDVLSLVDPELALRIRCEVTAGVVTLRGTAPSRELARRLADQVLDVEGVIAVRDELNVSPAG